MILYHSLCTAIVAVNPCPRILELNWHWLVLDGSFEVSELHLHVDNASTAYRTPIRIFHVLVVTKMVDTVAAAHEYHCLGRSEHVFTAYWAITVCGALNATMGISNGNRETHATSLAISGLADLTVNLYDRLYHTLQ